MEVAYVVCKECGAQWTLHGRTFWAVQQPRRCKTAECEAQWLDLPMFRDKADADRVAHEVAR